MKVTRFFQSCLLVEDGDARILIDPSGQESARLDEIGQLDAVLYTHEHSDHFNADLADRFAGIGVQIYANQSTAKHLSKELSLLENGKKFDIGSLHIKAIELPHCLMWDGSEGPQNTGLIIGDKLFHPGDGKELDGLKIENIALPITGPDISLKEANDFARQVGAKRALLIHYDYIGTKPQMMENAVKNGAYELVILNIGQTVDI